MKRKHFSLFAMLLIATGLLSTSCTQESIVRIHKNQTEISFSWWGNDARNEYTLKAIKEFERLHPDIKVVCHYSEWTGYQSRSNVQMASNTEADVMQINYAWINQYSPDGKGFYDINDLSEYIDLSNFEESELSYGMKDGSLNAIPIALNTQTVYINKDSEKIESSNDIGLDFKFFNDKVLLKDIDLENVYDEDLSPENLIKKHQLNINKAFLPDDIFEQNRLIERKKQEQILEWIYKPKYLRKFSGIENVGIGEFIDNGYFDAILEIWSLIGEIKESQIIGIKFFSKKYANEGYPGVLQYEFDRYNKSSDKEDAIRKYVNDTYRDVFRKVKDTVEYQLPRIISLFETLIGYAFKTKGLLTKDTLDLSNIIRYFEVGAKTLLGADMVEKGVPVITVRKIEKRKLEGNNLIEQKEYFYKHLFNYTLFLDAYEKELLKRYR